MGEKLCVASNKGHTAKELEGIETGFHTRNKSYPFAFVECLSIRLCLRAVFETNTRPPWIENRTRSCCGVSWEQLLGLEDRKSITYPLAWLLPRPLRALQDFHHHQTRGVDHYRPPLQPGDKARVQTVSRLGHQSYLGPSILGNLVNFPSCKCETGCMCVYLPLQGFKCIRDQ